MDCGSVLSGPRIFPTERSQSMSILSPQKSQPRMTHLESLEAKMANIEVSLSNSTNTPRRRKGTSLGGGSTVSSRQLIPATHSGTDTGSLHSNMKPEHQSALQEREAIIQSLRVQLGLGKLPRPGIPLDEAEISKAEQELQKLRNDADKKRITIRNLKSALESLDISDNIDIRIRQAEIEYALGREELQLLSLVEEIRALQYRLDKTLKVDSAKQQSSLYFQLKSGVNLSLFSVNANLGRFGVNIKEDDGGIYIEWALDGEALCQGDRIIEYNGKFIHFQSKDDIQKLNDSSGRCELVVIRKKKSQPNNNQMLAQSQEDNQRLQHRISYLEDLVKELQQSTKDIIMAPATAQNQTKNKNQQTNQNNFKGHVTSISISSSNQENNDKPQVFQRGNFIATIVGGKAIQASSNSIPIKINEVSTPTNTKPIHTNKTSTKDGRSTPTSNHSFNYHHLPRPGLQHSHSHQFIGSNNGKLYETPSKMTLDKNESGAHTYLKQKEKNHDHFKENHNNQRHSHRHSHPDLLYDDTSKSETKLLKTSQPDHNHGYTPMENRYRYKKSGNSVDMRSAKSLNFDDETKSNISSIPKHSVSRKPREVDYTSEPVATPLSSTSRIRNGRPTPPKKPLRLSLQRTQSLQTIEANAAATIIDLEKKRAVKRTYRGNKTPDLLHYDGESSSMYTASLGRSK